VFINFLSSMRDLTPAQIATLEKLAAAGFKFVTLPHVERYLAVEKGSFVALLEPAEGLFRVFGQVGLRLGEGMGMLVERDGRQAFVWHQERVAATPELLAGYQQFRCELGLLLETGSEQ
jgi:hypothetical protein